MTKLAREVTLDAILENAKDVAVVAALVLLLTLLFG